MKRAFSIFLLTLACAAMPLAADTPWSVRWGLTLFLEDNGISSDPMAVPGSLGAIYSLPLQSWLSFAPSAELYTMNVGWDDVLERVIPVSDENRTTRVIALQLNAPLEAKFDLPAGFALRAMAGLSADLRLCLLAEHTALDEAEVRADTVLVAQYLWQSLRWLLPVSGIGVDFPAFQRFRLGLDARVYAPLYRLWSGESALPAAEGWRISLALRIGIR